MQPWAVFAFRRNRPLGSLAQYDAALQAWGSRQESQRWREGRRENPSFLPQPHLARKLAGAAGRVPCPPPAPAQPVCCLWLESQVGLSRWCTSSFSLVEGGESCLKGSIPDRRLLLKPRSLYKLLYLWFHSTAFIVEVIRVMLYPIWSKLIPYLCMHQRGYEHQAFVAKIQLSKMRSECRIQQLNLVDQWDEWELAPGNSSKFIFVVLLFGNLGYEEVSHKDVPGRSVLSVFALSVWEDYTGGKSSSGTIYPFGLRDYGFCPNLTKFWIY